MGLVCDLSSFYASLNLPRSFSLACPIICGQQWVTISVQVNNIHKGISGLVFVTKEGSVGNYTLTTWSLSELLGQKLIIDEIWHNWRVQICQYDFRIMTTMKWIWKTNPFSSQGFKNVWHFKDAHRRPFAISLHEPVAAGGRDRKWEWFKLQDCQPTVCLFYFCTLVFTCY